MSGICWDCWHGIPHNLGPTGPGGGQVGILGPTGVGPDNFICFKCEYEDVASDERRTSCDRTKAKLLAKETKHAKKCKRKN